MGLIDQVLGLSPAVLSIRAQRAELMTSNLANADTPGYKAVDIDFREALAAEMGLAGTGAVRLRNSHPGHVDIASGGSASLGYRVPSQPSLDGNTVESDQEHAAFMDNAIRYQASLNFLEGRVQSLLTAIRGE